MVLCKWFRRSLYCGKTMARGRLAPNIRKLLWIYCSPDGARISLKIDLKLKMSLRKHWFFIVVKYDNNNYRFCYKLVTAKGAVWQRAAKGLYHRNSQTKEGNTKEMRPKRKEHSKDYYEMQRTTFNHFKRFCKDRQATNQIRKTLLIFCFTEITNYCV